MTAAVMDMSDLVRDLLAVLDEEIALEEAATTQLEGLSDAVFGRDRSVIEDLVDQSMDTHARFAAAELRRQGLCEAISAALGWPAGRLTMTRLVRELPGEAGRALDERRRRLDTLVNRVRRQHIRTAVHLQECARVNQMLLVRLFPQMESTTVYGSGGESHPRRGGSLVDARS
jgi:hypothetical protein